MEASLSKFAKCLFIPVRWGLGEAVNVKMAPAQGPERAFWGCQMELQPLTLGGLRLLERGPPWEPQPGPFNPPTEATERPLFIIPAARDPFRG